MARLDLWDLLSYISESDRRAAAKFGAGIFSAVERLREFPESGRIVPEFENPTIREIIRKPCRVVYRLKHDQKLVEIARIWHAARGILEI
jgi:plasmid stabilization system protein ParE